MKWGKQTTLNEDGPYSISETYNTNHRGPSKNQYPYGPGISNGRDSRSYVLINLTFCLVSPPDY